jgi:hypothetical protein
MNRLLLYTLVFLCIAGTARAQQFESSVESDPSIEADWSVEADSSEESPYDAHIMLVAKATGEGVVLRWAPDMPGAFHILNTYGYRIERIRVGADGEIDPAPAEMLTPEPLKPWPLDEWKRRIMQDTTQISLAVAAQLMHGTFVTPPKNPDDDLEVLRNGVRDAENRFGFALMLADTDPQIAEGMALRFVDREVRPGERVIYRVMPAQQATDYVIDTAVIVLTAEVLEGNPAPENLRFTSGDRSITLQWDQNPFAPYSAWQVERSADGGRSWQLLTKRPHVIIAAQGDERNITPSYEDKVDISNYTQYGYRVRGINAFGERSDAAEITAWAVDQSGPAAPTITRAEQISRDGVVIQWDQPESPADLQGYIVSRAANPKSTTPFMPLHEGMLSPDTRMFMDADAHDREAWYLVTAVDTAGNRSESVRKFVQIIDSLPPAAPRGVAARIDSTGLVTISWLPNTEEDLDGYRVLWANSLDHEFSQLTPQVHRDTVITHQITLQTSTEHVYYKIVAVDKRFMHSIPSEIIELKRPDILPPDAPVFTDVRVSENAVSLHWARSGSADVKEQRFERRSAGEDWRMIATLDTAATSYTDTGVVRGIEYQYRVTAVDDDGLLARCPNIVTGRPYDTGRRADVRDVRAVYNDEDNTVTVSWDYAAAVEEEYWFVIYRSEAGGQPLQYSTAAADARSWTEPGHRGRTYHYAVRVKSGSGESPLSSVASVTIQ